MLISWFTICSSFSSSSSSSSSPEDEPYPLTSPVWLSCKGEFTSPASSLIDRVTAHLQHVNPAVVLATIKVIVRNLPQIEYSSNSLIMKRLSSAFVSLMSTPPEMQYVALKNIRIDPFTRSSEFTLLQKFHYRSNPSNKTFKNALWIVQIYIMNKLKKGILMFGY